jgi:predicted lipoprotein with Yx(FWY)xxD motif
MLGLAACGSSNKTTSSANQSATTVAPATTAAPAVTTTAPAAVVKTSTKDPFGTYLTDATGKSLYAFDRDTTPNTSSCTGQCATTWPPLLLPAGQGTPIPTPTGVTGTLTVAPRPDGAGSQIVWNGKPLYRYSGDSNPGDTNGDGVGGIWHIAKLTQP